MYRILAVLACSACAATAAWAQDTDVASFSRQSAAEACVPMRSYVDAPGIQRLCRVNEFGSLGRVGETEVLYALYRRLVIWPELELSLADTAETALDTLPYNNTAVAIFHAARGDSLLHSVWSEMNDGWIGVSWYERPRLLSTPVGTVLSIGLRYTGTGSFNDDRYFMWRDGGWTRIDTSAWATQLQSLLPEGHGVWKGVVLDLGRMEAETPVWREGDGNCCPSGGRVTLELGLDGDRLVVERAVHTPAENGADP